MSVDHPLAPASSLYMAGWVPCVTSLDGMIGSDLVCGSPEHEVDQWPARGVSAVCNAVAVTGDNESMESQARFEALYRRYAPVVKSYALRRADPSIADDVVSDVFLVCWRRLEEVPADVLPWLLEVARRALSTRRRGENRRHALSDRLAATAIDVEAQSVGSGSLRAALESLSAADRELLLLIAWEDLTPTQAATALGIKAPTLRVRLLRARRRLASALEAVESSGSPAPHPSIPQPSEGPQ
jgi:RNA polymerase sigma-70 factor, ECF subfamily